MKNTFNFIRQSRTAFIQLIDGLSLEELNHIPEGFNNNIIWNFGHIIVSTQTLCYVRTGIRQSADFVQYLSAYQKGSKPSYTVTQEEVDNLKELALSTIAEIEADYDKGLFATIQPYDTATYGAILNSFEEVVLTTIGHDNLHLGYAIAQRRAIKK